MASIVRFERMTFRLGTMGNYKISIFIIKNRKYCENYAQNCVLFSLILLPFALFTQSAPLSLCTNSALLQGFMVWVHFYKHHTGIISVLLSRANILSFIQTIAP